MKELKDILFNVHPVTIIGDAAIAVNELRLDSRKVEVNDVFFAVKGSAVDGHTFIPKVIEQGASVIVCEESSGSIAGSSRICAGKRCTQNSGNNGLQFL
jgi:UDP-N-acetylmuramoyl-L-alanyl-D-glutamate--2,6-diaminopimelate ligase